MLPVHWWSGLFALAAAGELGSESSEGKFNYWGMRVFRQATVDAIGHGEKRFNHKNDLKAWPTPGQ